MNTASKFLISHSQKIVYRPVPKCASTTMHKFFLNISGINTTLEPREAVWGSALAAERKRAGLEGASVEAEAVADFVSRYESYSWISVVRDPYERCVSGYEKQIWRFAKKYERKSARRAKLYRSFVNLLPMKRDKKYHLGMARIKELVPFEMFLDGLVAHGPSFDPHFAPQSDIIHFSNIKFDRIIKLEELDQGLRDVFSMGKGGTAEGAIPRLNSSSSVKTYHTALSDALKEKIYALYQRDFENLGYSR